MLSALGVVKTSGPCSYMFGALYSVRRNVLLSISCRVDDVIACEAVLIG